MAVSYLSELNVDEVFLSSMPFPGPLGFTTPDFNQARSKNNDPGGVRSNHAQRWLELESFPLQFAALSDDDKLITDKIDPQAADQLQHEVFDLVIA